MIPGAFLMFSSKLQPHVGELIGYSPTFLEHILLTSHLYLVLDSVLSIICLLSFSGVESSSFSNFP